VTGKIITYTAFFQSLIEKYDHASLLLITSLQIFYKIYVYFKYSSMNCTAKEN